MKLRIILSFIISCMVGFQMYAQPNASYEKLEEKDNVSIYYKWKKKFPYGKDADRVLVLYIDNGQHKNVAVSFSVDIFKNGAKQSSSGILNYCMPADYEMKGRFKNLAFETGLSWEELNSDHFVWEINEFKIEKYTGDCTSQSNWLTTK